MLAARPILSLYLKKKWAIEAQSAPMMRRLGKRNINCHDTFRNVKGEWREGGN